MGGLAVSVVRSGQQGAEEPGVEYEGGFVAHYLGPVVHPVRADVGLGPAAGISLVAINVAVYFLVIVWYKARPKETVLNRR